MCVKGAKACQRKLSSSTPPRRGAVASAQPSTAQPTREATAAPALGAAADAEHLQGEEDQEEQEEGGMPAGASYALDPRSRFTVRGVVVSRVVEREDPADQSTRASVRAVGWVAMRSP